MRAVTAYLEAINTINAAERKLERIQTITAKAAAAMSGQWALVAVSGVPRPHTPDVPSRKPRRVINGSEWPTAEEIAQALRTLHAAYDAAAEAWDRITPECRARFFPPPVKLALGSGRPESLVLDVDPSRVVPRVRARQRPVRRYPKVTR